MKNNDGGPAFPYQEIFQDTSGNIDVKYKQGGMSLRDWFAGQALMGMLSNTNNSKEFMGDFAEWAYRQANAMLAERAKGE